MCAGIRLHVGARLPKVSIPVTKADHECRVIMLIVSKTCFAHMLQGYTLCIVAVMQRCRPRVAQGMAGVVKGIAEPIHKSNRDNSRVHS